jgi:putative addiction module CopG family antidote
LSAQHQHGYDGHIAEGSECAAPTSRIFDTASEAVREGLRLLEEHEQEREAVLAELRHDIEIGVEQAKAGKLTDGRAFFEHLRQKRRSAS